MLIKNLDKYLYPPSTPIKEAISDLYENRTDICLIVNSKRILKGVLTTSDIRQAILDGFDPKWPIRTIINQNFISATEQLSKQQLIKLSLKKTRFGSGYILKVPILAKNGEIKALYINSEKKYQTPKTVLVTGGAGYLGSVLCSRLIERGYKVIVLDRLDFGRSSIKNLLTNKNFELIKGNVSIINDLINGLKYTDYVIHLAGIVGDPASSFKPLDTLEINHFSTKSLIEISKYCQISKFIFASTCSVYGASNSTLDERSKVNPISLYARSKLYTERDLVKASDKYFRPTILRFGTLYGISPRMRFDLVVNLMTAQAFFQKNISVFGGLQWRPFIHVQDAADACIMALEVSSDKVGGKIFNVGSSAENYQIVKIAKIIKQMLPKTKIIENKENKDSRNYKVSFKKIRKELNFKNSHKLGDGILEIIRAFKRGKFKDFDDKNYSNYVSLKHKFGETLIE